jgi:fermentation-respiration switch protein FrsA (DUF1100 family)
VALWALQRQLIFFPDPAAVPPAAEVIDGARDVTLHTADGLELGAWFVPAASGDRDGPRHAVLVAPGNGGNRLGRASLAERLSERGFAVLLMDYRGYGGNPGSPSEKGIVLDADAAVAALTDLGYPPDRTVYLGESLGTGVVAALARRTLPAAMVLRSPFTDLADVGAHHYPWLPVRLLLTDRFAVLENVRQTDVPTVVVYGDRDSVVPARFSAAVADAAPRLVDEIVLEGVDHNDPVMFGEPVVDAVERAASAAR